MYDYYVNYYRIFYHPATTMMGWEDECHCSCYASSFASKLGQLYQVMPRKDFVAWCKKNLYTATVLPIC